MCDAAATGGKRADGEIECMSLLVVAACNIHYMLALLRFLIYFSHSLDGYDD